MVKRTFSTLALWTIVLSLLYFFHDAGAVWIVAILTGATLFEFYALLKHMGYDPFDKLGITVGVAVILGPYYLSRWGLHTVDLVAFGVIAFSIRVINERNPQNRVETLAASLFGITYVPVMLQYFVRIINLHTPHPNTGLILFLWVVAVSKFCDVGALLSGMAFGRTKMAPIISPKKTWEGAIGGCIISALIGAAIAYGARDYLPPRFTPLFAGLFALPLAALAIVADLVESIIKRRATIKDSGATIPGIGGMFDVTDSLILTAPAAFMVFGLL
ncbi:MAG TPA: phosphatidate cytidylyltransferase [Opitutaceae bacterium]|nr:phosphatidate cytidylyltransferase [Opitutaceae bacterium]